MVEESCLVVAIISYVNIISTSDGDTFTGKTGVEAFVWVDGAFIAFKYPVIDMLEVVADCLSGKMENQTGTGTIELECLLYRKAWGMTMRVLDKKTASAEHWHWLFRRTDRDIQNLWVIPTWTAVVLSWASP